MLHERPIDAPGGRGQAGERIDGPGGGEGSYLLLRLCKAIFHAEVRASFEIGAVAVPGKEGHGFFFFITFQG